MLNEELHARLKQEFGHVKVSKEGQRPTFDKKPSRRGWKVTKIQDSGEEYQVCCPFCNDTRYRLYIPHTYGLRLKEGDTETRFPTYAKCFNEDCLSNLRNAKDLRRVVLKGEVPMLMRRTYESKVTKTTKKVVYPKKLERFPELPESNKGKRYLRSRGYDLELLDSVGFRWVPENPHPIVEESIFIPIIDHNMEVVGGQCRLPYAVEGNFPPKYYTLPNSTLSTTLYNLWRVTGPVVVVTEGVFDALALGTLGVAILGSHLSQPQIKLLAKKDIVLFALDPDVYDEPAKRENVHTAIDTLQNRGTIVEKVDIPEDEDPDSLGQKRLWTIVEDALKQAKGRQKCNTSPTHVQ